jgi:hypothetical protein
MPQAIGPDTQKAVSGSNFSDTTEQRPQFRFSDADTTFHSDGNSGSDLSNVPNSIFDGHALIPVNFSPVPFTPRNPDWFTIVILLVFVGLAWIRVFYYKILKQLFSAFFSNLVSNQIVRDENILVQRASILMSFIFYLVASLFAYQLTLLFGWNPAFMGQGFLRFLFIALFIAAAYSVKMVVLKALGELFDVDKPVATYIFNIFLINNMTGLILIPVVVLSAYATIDWHEWILYSGLGFVIMMFIYRLVRAVRIWMSMTGTSYFYLILYFCTLEIAPLMILFKLAGG